MLSFTVVLCTKDRADDVRKCLDSIALQTRLPNELLVVDSGTDDTRNLVLDFEKNNGNINVQYLRSEPGLTRQRNVGIRAAKTEVLHFFDDDCTLEPEYFARLQEAFESDTALLGAGPKLFLPYIPSPLGRLWRKTFLLADVAGTGRIQPSGFGTYPWFAPNHENCEVDVLCGCCAFRRTVFDSVMFDEYFAGYGYLEDLEFSYRVGKLGKLLYVPAARMTHWESPSARTNWRKLAKMQIVNHHYVFKKHLPQDLYHRSCFVWSEIGESIRRMSIFIKTGQLDIVKGMIDGYWALMRNTNESRHS